MNYDCSQQKWLVIYTKPRKEALARQHLINQGVKVYFPEISVEKIQRGKAHQVIEPLFPRYLFIKIPENLAWTSVRSSRGVQDFVKFGQEVAEVDDGIIQEIATCNEKHVNDRLTNIPKDGDRIMIKEGQFKGLQAIYKQRDGEQRCFVLLELLGNTHRLRMELAQIEKAS